MKIIIAVLVFLLSSFSYASMKDDSFYMRMAIKVAKQNPQAPFGALIVDNKSGKILAEGVNAVHGKHNPTLHGEMVVINNYAKQYPHVDWKNVTLYTTCEPCPMCQSAIVWAGIPRVVFGTSAKFIGEHGWEQFKLTAEEVNHKASSFYQGTVTGGVLADETNPLFLNQK